MFTATVQQKGTDDDSWVTYHNLVKIRNIPGMTRVKLTHHDGETTAIPVSWVMTVDAQEEYIEPDSDSQ